MATRVLLFGRLREAAGWRDRTFDPTPATLFALKERIVAECPDLAAALDAPGVRAAIDRILASGDAELSPGAEVAFLPPMSGG